MQHPIPQPAAPPPFPTIQTILANRLYNMTQGRGNRAVDGYSLSESFSPSLPPLHKLPYVFVKYQRPFHPHTLNLTPKLDDSTVMNHPVNRCHRRHRIFKNLVPLRKDEACAELAEVFEVMMKLRRSYRSLKKVNNTSIYCSSIGTAAVSTANKLRL